MKRNKILRVSTIGLSLNYLLKGQLNFLNTNYDVIGISSKDRDLETVRQREKIKIIAVPMQRAISPINDLISLFKLFVVFKKEKPKIVHSITPKAGLLSMIAAKLAGVPIRIHTYTGLIFPTKTGLMKSVIIAMDRLLCKCATNIYPEGLGVMQDLINYKITAKPLRVLANGNVNGIDIQYFNSTVIHTEEKQQLKKELNIRNEDFVFIFAGRLVGDKGINELVSAFKKLSEEDEHLKLLLVGPLESELDPLSPTTIELIEQCQHIISVGFQSDVRPYFAISNVLAFPSYREGFPNVVMQAGSMGLPAIVSNINGCNEIIVDGENGLIIPVKDADALYLAMKRLVTDANLTLSLKGKSRAMITSRFEQQVVWDAILAEYKRLEQHHV